MERRVVGAVDFVAAGGFVGEAVGRTRLAGLMLVLRGFAAFVTEGGLVTEDGLGAGFGAGFGCATILTMPVGRTKSPCIGGQSKYRSPLTEPSFFPSGEESSTPKNWPVET